MKIVVSGNAELVVKRAFFLAWKACGGPAGLGFLQDKGEMSEEEVWGNVQTRGDYPIKRKPTACHAYGDYVFGRMMKLRLSYDDKSITVDDAIPRADYQAWCVDYPTYTSLIVAAATSLGIPTLASINPK